MSELPAEDAKLITLARAARARTGAVQGAAVRDGDGRTHAAAGVALPSLTLSALQLAVANAVSAGARVIEAAAVVGEGTQADPRLMPAAGADPGITAVRDLSPDAPIFLATPDGSLTGRAG